MSRSIYPMRSVLTNITCILDASCILSRMGATSQDDIGRELLRIVEAAQKVVRPKSLYKICTVEATGPTSVTIEGVQFESAQLSRNLQGITHVFSYIATCGTEIDAVQIGEDPFLGPFCKELLKEQSLMAARSALFSDIEKVHTQGPLASMNPGSGPHHLWPIEQQRPLFHVLEDVETDIGVTLTPSCLMTPNKTISGILFPGSEGFVTCRLCPRSDCPNRRAPFDDTDHVTGPPNR